MQYFLFTVTKQSWKEHFSTGIAAINNPGHDKNNRQGNAKKQKALCELAGIKRRDLFFFYLQQEKKLMGLYEAVSDPFFDTKPLVKGGFINYKFPIRVAFKQKINFPIHLDMDEVWDIKDKGYFWSLQQQRGEAVGRHACITLTKQDGEILLRMFYEKNPIISNPIKVKNASHSNRKLTLDYRRDNETGLHYEAVLQATMLGDFKNGKHKEFFGNYDYFIPFFPTSSQLEIDILLLKHDTKGVLWFEILELKPDEFTIDELNKLINYERWVTTSLANNNKRSVYSIAVAHEFSDEVKNFVKGRTQYDEKTIKLIEYSFNGKSKKLMFKDVTPQIA